MKYISILMLILLLSGCSTKQPIIKNNNCVNRIPKTLLIPSKNYFIPSVNKKLTEEDLNKLNVFIIDLYFTNKENTKKIEQIDSIIEKCNKN
jgi:PBP1b-binding outer membrane lipoprotein LpoB